MEQGNGNQVVQGQGAAKFGGLLRASLLSAAVCTGLSSCWFNTAGFVFDTASYDAKATTADIAVGTEVYEKNGSYYVYLPTYKTGKGPKLIYGIGAQDQREERHQKNGHDYFRISTPYARYLTGQSDVAAEPEIYVDENACRTKSKWKVVRTVEGNAECTFEDSCFGSSLLNLFGLVDLVCVDVPMSAVCTTGLVVGSVASGTYSLAKFFSKDPEAATTAADIPVPEIPAGQAQPQTQSHNSNLPDSNMNVCWKCKGTVLQDSTYVMPDGSQRKLYKICPNCQGKGVTPSLPVSGALPR